MNRGKIYTAIVAATLVIGTPFYWNYRAGLREEAVMIIVRLICGLIGLFLAAGMMAHATDKVPREEKLGAAIGAGSLIAFVGGIYFTWTMFPESPIWSMFAILPVGLYAVLECSMLFEYNEDR